MSHTLYSVCCSSVVFVYNSCTVVSVDAWLMFNFVERVEGVGHGHSLGEGAFVRMLQHLVLIRWKPPITLI